jgi:hypothetical protein
MRRVSINFQGEQSLSNNSKELTLNTRKSTSIVLAKEQ